MKPSRRKFLSPAIALTICAVLLPVRIVSVCTSGVDWQGCRDEAVTLVGLHLSPGALLAVTVFLPMAGLAYIGWALDRRAEDKRIAKRDF